MRTTVGLGVGAAAVRAVAVRGRAIEWTAETSLEAGSSLVDGIREVLSFVPRTRWRRVEVRAAVGPAASQVKVLRGLPPIGDPGAVSALVRENAHRFFLGNGGPLLTSDVLEADDGGFFAAAFDGHVVHQVREACELEKLELRSVIPTAIVLPEVLSGDRLVWQDGVVAAEIASGAAGPSIRVRRSTDFAHDALAGEPDPRLVDLGEEGWRFADALGAAASRGHALTYRPHRNGSGKRSYASGAKLRKAAVAAFLAWLAAMLAPGVTATIAARSAEGRLRALSPRWVEASRAESDVRQIHRALTQITTFSASGPSPLLLLADLAGVLPDGGTIHTLTLDSSAVTLSVVVPRATSFVEALDALPSIRSPQVRGPILRESVDGAAYERATVEFTVDDAGATGRRGTEQGGAP